MRPLIILMIVLSSTFQSYASQSAQTFNFNGKIVFSAGKSRKNVQNIFVLDRDNIQPRKLTHEGFNMSPKWSPDGKKIVFRSSGRRSHRNSEIYIMDMDGKNEQRLTVTTNGNSSDPRWDSTGTKIFFTSAIKGDVQENVVDISTFMKETLGKTGGVPEVKPVKDIEDYIIELNQPLENIEKRKDELKQWFDNLRGLAKYLPSPDGKYLILFYDFAKKIVLLDTDIGYQKELATHNPGQPAWSKDGKRIAYVNGDRGDYFLIYDVDKNQYTEVKFHKERDAGCGGELSWSRDSKNMVYSCGIDYKEDSSWLYILDLETKKPIKLVRGNSPDWY